MLIAAQTGIGGSTTVGDNTMIGGHCGVADNIHIGKDVKMGGKTGVTGSVKDGEVVFGYPHRSARDAKKVYGLLSLMVKHASKVKKLIRELPE